MTGNMIVLLIRLNGIFLRYRTSYVSIIARNYIAVVLFTLVTAYSVQYLDYRNESKIFHRDITLSNFPNLENSHVRESTRRKGEKVFLQNFLPSPCSKFFTLINSRFYGYRDHGNSHFKRKLCTLFLSLENPVFVVRAFDRPAHLKVKCPCGNMGLSCPCVPPRFTFARARVAFGSTLLIHLVSCSSPFLHFHQSALTCK